jgi:hypothetical protein
MEQSALLQRVGHVSLEPNPACGGAKISVQPANGRFSRLRTEFWHPTPTGRADGATGRGRIRRRQEKLQLEQRKREALEQLREVAALVQDVLPEIEREESMIGGLRPERRGATTTGS